MPLHYLYREDEDSQNQIQYAWFQAMHTRIDTILYHPSKEFLKRVVCRVHDEVLRLEKIGSFYDTQSELYRVNQSASSEPVILNTELFHMIELSLEYNAKTSGCFDVTVQSRYYDNKTIHHIILMRDDQSVFYGRPEMQIDLSGFLKGYALEQVRIILSSEGLNDALISMGGSSVLALGNHPFGTGWKIDYGTTDNKTPSEIFIENQCLSTSGNDTVKREHIISPSTGKYVEGVKYVSLITKNALEGEILSTALCVATEKQEKDIIQNFDVERIIHF